jgi:transcriptional regulator with XRE-family HTH domain
VSVVADVATTAALRALREDLGLSRAVLAAFLGVAEMTVMRWETRAGHTPHGLHLVVLDAIERARAAAGAAAVARLIRSQNSARSCAARPHSLHRPRASA